MAPEFTAKLYDECHYTFHGLRKAGCLCLRVHETKTEILVSCDPHTSNQPKPMKQKALTPKCPRSFQSVQNSGPLRSALTVGCLLALLSLLTLGASAQTNFFTDGISTSPGSDAYPGFAGDDTTNTPGSGWSSQWSYDPSSANRTQLTGEQVINTFPLNGGGNYLNWYSWNPGDSGGGATIYRVVNTNIPSMNGYVDVTKPWVVEFDWRLDVHLEDTTGNSNAVANFGVTNGTGSSSTAFSGRQDQFQFFNSSAATSGDTGGGGSYWVKLVGANTTKANSLTNRYFGFWDAGTTMTAENHGIYWNATSVNFIATNNIYHFKFVMDTANYTYEGFITNVTAGTGFSTTVAAGHKLRSRNNVPVVFPWWTNGPTLYSGHTNPCPYIDWEARSQNGVAALAGSKAGWCPTNFMSMDNLVVYQVASNMFPPALTQVNPHLNHTFYPASSNFIFSAYTYSGNTLPASGVILTLNGVNVSAGLSLTGSDSDTNRTMTYSGLLDNTIYNVGVSVADSGGVVTSNYFIFDTFNTNTSITIETENYNFDPTLTSCLSSLGQTDVQTDRFIQNWVYSGISYVGTLINPTNGYVGRASDRGIDYSNTVSSSANGDAEGAFRACESGTIATFGGGTGSPSTTQFNVDDDVRQVYLDFNDLGMVEVNTMKVGLGDWWNYTHIWPAGNYVAYLRGSAYNTSTKIPLVLNLGVVIENGVSSYTNMTQVTTNMGTFTLPINNNVTVNSIAYTHPLLDTNGFTRVINLNGKQTLKLAVASGDTVNNDSAWVNYMVFVPVPNILISNATEISSSDYRFFFNSISNVHYTIQTNTVLNGSKSWTLMTTKVGTGGSVQVDDTSGSGSNLFYRVTTP